jgi:hypothetical protein
MFLYNICNYEKETIMTLRTFYRNQALFAKAKQAANFRTNKQFSFGQKVVIRFWLGSHLETGMDYINTNAAEEKWVAAQNPEVDWEAIDDEYITKLLAAPERTEIPRILY